MIDDALRTIVLAYSGVSALTTRVYAVIAPDDATYPCIVYQRISKIPRHNVAKNMGLATSRYQFVCWAFTSKAARELGEQLRLALDNYQGTGTGTTIQHITEDSSSDMDNPSPDRELIRLYGYRSDFL